MGNVVSKVLGWLNEPFTTPLDTKAIFLLVGIVAVSIIVWNMILYHIRIAAQEIG